MTAEPAGEDEVSAQAGTAFTSEGIQLLLQCIGPRPLHRAGEVSQDVARTYSQIDDGAAGVRLIGPQHIGREWITMPWHAMPPELNTVRLMAGWPPRLRRPRMAVTLGGSDAQAVETARSNPLGEAWTGDGRTKNETALLCLVVSFYIG